MEELIIEQVRQIKVKSVPGIFLDIDDTICATNLYIARLFNEKYGNAEKLSPEKIVMKYRYPEKVPSWQTPTIAKEQDKIFNKGVHIPFCHPIEGAIEYVLKIDSIVPISGYLTERPDRFHDITIRWLEKHGFPKRPVIMRPEDDIFIKAKK